MNPENASGGNEDFVELDPEKVEDRALDIAQENGRYEANTLDREDSRQELREPPTDDQYAEEQIDENDRPDAGVAPVSSGHKVERVPLEDEVSAVEELVQGGIDEADDNTRHHSGSNREI